MREVQCCVFISHFGHVGGYLWGFESRRWLLCVQEVCFRVVLGSTLCCVSVSELPREVGLNVRALIVLCTSAAAPYPDAGFHTTVM